MGEPFWRRLFKRQDPPAAAPPAPRPDEKAITDRARERMQQGDLDGAIADFSKAIELNPEHVDAYANRGVARERKGDLAGAKEDYSKSLEIQIRLEIERQIKSQDTQVRSENPEA